MCLCVYFSIYLGCLCCISYSYIQVNQFKIFPLSLCSSYNRVHQFSRLKGVVLSPALGQLGLVTQLHLTLCHPMDCSLPGSSVRGIYQQKYWSELLFPPPGDMLDPGIEPGSLALQADSLPSEPQGKPTFSHIMK